MNQPTRTGRSQINENKEEAIRENGRNRSNSRTKHTFTQIVKRKSKIDQSKPSYEKPNQPPRNTNRDEQIKKLQQQINELCNPKESQTPKAPT